MVNKTMLTFMHHNYNKMFTESVSNSGQAYQKSGNVKEK